MTSNGHDHKHCLELFEKLSEYIDGELDHATCSEIKRHAEDCVACFSCLETLKRTVDLCKNVEEKPIPVNLSEKLMEIIQQIPKTPLP
jgi:anti-sigma factor (TIGR02949 family)